MNLLQEFDRQLSNLIEKQYHNYAGISEREFINIITPLKEQLQDVGTPDVDLERGYVPFVIVIQRTLVELQFMMKLSRFNNKEGIEKMFPHTPHDFNTIEQVHIPSSQAYILIDIDRGKEFLNIPPQDAMKMITEKNRSPLTIEEGIALITHFPEFLIKNNCFSLLASRVMGNQRVPAIWINKDKHANLGWCWNGNPHTWLGSASCKTRIASHEE